MPLPAAVANISSIAVIGVPIKGKDFPQIRPRRAPANLAPDDMFVMDKPADQITDFSVDLTFVLDPVPTEAIISAYAWSSAPTVLVVTSCRFADQGITANVWGGLDGTSYVLYLHAQTNKGRALQFCIQIDVEGVAGTYVAQADGSLPKDAYLVDLLGVAVYPVYTDMKGSLLSVPL